MWTNSIHSYRNYSLTWKTEINLHGEVIWFGIRHEMLKLHWFFENQTPCGETSNNYNLIYNSRLCGKNEEPGSAMCTVGTYDGAKNNNSRVAVLCAEHCVHKKILKCQDILWLFSKIMIPNWREIHVFF